MNDSDEQGERVVVLVDGSTATGRALRLALRFALDRRALLTIAAYAPGPPAHDDAESRRLDGVLLAAQAEAEVAGVAAERCLLRGPDPLAQLAGLVAPSPSCDRLVLCSPAVVDGPLRALARRLAQTPPCLLYIAPQEPTRLESWRSRLIGWLLEHSAERQRPQ